jgi:peroxiredoxin (alkyl hydroperoxide reductase subunit C)
MPLGRNVNEYLRMVDAYTYQEKEVALLTGKLEAMSADRQSTAEYLSLN